MSREELPGLFLTAFQNKVNHIRSDLDNLTSDIFSVVQQTDGSISNFPFFTLSKFETVNENIVRDTILKSPSKSCGLDHLPTNLTKLCSDELPQAITKIIDTSLVTRHVLPPFKKAVINSLLKEDDVKLNNHRNYCPVSKYFAFIQNIRKNCAEANSAVF